jgi:hypothetical protein
MTNELLMRALDEAFIDSVVKLFGVLSASQDFEAGLARFREGLAYRMQLYDRLCERE